MTIWPLFGSFSVTSASRASFGQESPKTISVFRVFRHNYQTRLQP